MRLFSPALVLPFALGLTELAAPDQPAAQIGGIKKPKITPPTISTPAIPVPTTQAPAPAPAAEPAAQPAAAEPAAAPAGGAAEAKPAEKPGQGAWVNYDFQPGVTPLYVDDFTKDRVGNFPQRLEFRKGNMEIAEWKGARYIRATTAYAEFAVNLKEPLPERFTVELDATPSVANIEATIVFDSTAPSKVVYSFYNARMTGGIGGTGPTAKGAARTESGPDDFFRLRVMVDGTYAKVYINDTRVANVPNANLGRSTRIIFSISGTEEQPVFIGNFSIMAGGRELYDALVESGRVATQGIYFDTGSDRIRPESTPTLVEISEMLKGHEDLTILIEGHTDNVGNAASNQTLSERRAAAVRQALIDIYAIDGARMTTAGFGATKPAAPNTTPEGRQANRRVELVKK